MFAAPEQENKRHDTLFQKWKADFKAQNPTGSADLEKVYVEKRYVSELLLKPWSISTDDPDSIPDTVDIEFSADNFLETFSPADYATKWWAQDDHRIKLVALSRNHLPNPIPTFDAKGKLLWGRGLKGELVPMETPPNTPIAPAAEIKYIPISTDNLPRIKLLMSSKRVFPASAFPQLVAATAPLRLASKYDIDMTKLSQAPQLPEPDAQQMRMLDPEALKKMKQLLPPLN